MDSILIQIKSKSNYFDRHYSVFCGMVRIIDLVSQTTYVVCVKFLYISGGGYSLNSTPSEIFLRSISWQFYYLLSEFLQEIC